MRALIAKELREIWWLPVGLLGVLGAVTYILHLQGYWSQGLIFLYMWAGLLLALYLGADTISADRLQQRQEWHYLWPVSRLQWWMLRFVMNLVITLVVGIAAMYMLVWLAQHHTPVVDLGYTLKTVWPIGSLSFFFVVAFFASGLTRTAAGAFGLSLVLSLVFSVLAAMPLYIYTAMAMRNQPHLPSPYLSYAASGIIIIALITGSLRGFLTTPVLEVGRRARRSLGTAAAIIIPALLVMLMVWAATVLRVEPKPQGISHSELSPDGKQVVFSESFGKGLWLINTDGTGLRRLTTEQADKIIWLKDSRRLVFGSVVMAEVKSPNGRRGRRRSFQSTNDFQWWYLDTGVEKPEATKLFVVPRVNGTAELLSPQGKYLWLGGEFVDTNTWQRLGKVAVPNYEPWFLTWLPDDSAIFVSESGADHRRALKRIAVPSAETKPLTIPGLPNLNVNFFSPWGSWMIQDRSYSVPLPKSQYRPVQRTYPVRTPDGKTVKRTYTYMTNTYRQVLVTRFRRIDGTRYFDLPGWGSYNASMSDSERYCFLMRKADRSDEFGMDPRRKVKQEFAVLDMRTGKIVRSMFLELPDMFRPMEMKWSQDEKRVAFYAEAFGQREASAVYILGLDGKTTKVAVPEGSSFGMGSEELLGWTPAGEVIFSQGNRLLAIGSGGQIRTVLQTRSRFDALEERAKAMEAKKKAGSQP
ncbi:MAG: hypothetical protein ABFE08_21485 [Armatimonadia bacterium]